MLNGWTELDVFDKDSVTGNCYCKEVILPYVRLFRGTAGPVFVFMDENAWLHQTCDVQQLLEIIPMDWPDFSHDLNPIEHVWDALGRRLAAQLNPPGNTQQLKQMMIEEWVLLLEELLDNLVLSMKRRCEAIIVVRGGHIPF
ncbi:transposable element Tcb2 transposase [Trichonephila clavipes]|nr:transposable element Tcb2 transposase [Trichonephila clavipes]